MPKQILKDALLLPAALQINYPKLSLSFELFRFFPFCSACIFISFRFALSYKAWTAFIAMSYKSFYQGVISYERTTTITKTERCSFYDKCRKENLDKSNTFCWLSEELWRRRELPERRLWKRFRVGNRNAMNMSTQKKKKKRSGNSEELI